MARFPVPILDTPTNDNEAAQEDPDMAENNTRVLYGISRVFSEITRIRSVSL